MCPSFCNNPSELIRLPSWVRGVSVGRLASQVHCADVSLNEIGACVVCSSINERLLVFPWFGSYAVIPAILFFFCIAIRPATIFLVCSIPVSQMPALYGNLSHIWCRVPRPTMRSLVTILLQQCHNMRDYIFTVLRCLISMVAVDGTVFGTSRTDIGGQRRDGNKTAALEKQDLIPERMWGFIVHLARFVGL